MSHDAQRWGHEPSPAYVRDDWYAEDAAHVRANHVPLRFRAWTVVDVYHEAGDARAAKPAWIPPDPKPADLRPYFRAALHVSSTTRRNQETFRLHWICVCTAMVGTRNFELVLRL